MLKVPARTVEEAEQELWELQNLEREQLQRGERRAALLTGTMQTFVRMRIKELKEKHGTV